MRIYSALIILYFLCCSCHDKRVKHNVFSKSDSSDISSHETYTQHLLAKAIEDTIINKVFDLEKVKERTEHLARNTKPSRKLSAIIIKRPSNDSNYYWVKVIEDNGCSYTTHFIFRVDPKTLEVLCYDPVQDTLISVNIL